MKKTLCVVAMLVGTGVAQWTREKAVQIFHTHKFSATQVVVTCDQGKPSAQESPIGMLVTCK